ncbi:30S ribosomal protein S7 [bacterium]|nr:30S ribosomal protein S7 [bacterium]
MARRRTAQRREITPDPVHRDKVVAKFINCMMEEGKKSTAQQIFYGALAEAAKKAGGAEPLDVFRRIMDNTRPIVEVRSRRVGGATYQVPVEIPSYRQDSLAIRWIVSYARGRKGQPMQRALAAEFLDAYNNSGNVIKKREDTHKMAEANRAFAHYRW